ncbi:MAG: hypothetical protein M1819_000816, partial [Sarea resinae]
NELPTNNIESSEDVEKPEDVERPDELSTKNIESLVYDNENTVISVYWRLKRFIITFSGSDSGIEAQYVKNLHDASLQSDETNDSDPLNKAWNELEQFAIDVSQPLIQHLALTVDKPETGYTLEVELFPETFMLQVVTIQGTAKAIERKDMSPPCVSFIAQPPPLWSRHLPIYCLSEVKVLQRMLPTRIYKVEVDGQLLCCKVADRRFPEISKEIETLHKLKELDMTNPIRIPKLRGLVVTEDKKSVVGFLMDFIDTSESFRQLAKSMCKVTQSRRETWMEQIERIVCYIHRNGEVWGDAKPDNLLLDKDDNVWLIDFGGSRTEGWVDEAVENTTEGDLMAVSRIRSFFELA